MRISSISRGKNNNNKKNRYSLHTHIIFFSLFLIAIFKSYDTTSNPYSVRHNMWLCVCLFLGPQTRTHNNIIPTLNGVEKNKYWNDKRTWCAPHLSMSTFKSFSHQMMVPRGPCTSNYINYTYRLGYPLSYKYILNIYIRHTRTWIKAQKKKIACCARHRRKWFSKGLCKHTRILYWEEATSRGVPSGGDGLNSSHSQQLSSLCAIWKSYKTINHPGGSRHPISWPLYFAFLGLHLSSKRWLFSLFFFFTFSSLRIVTCFYIAIFHNPHVRNHRY